MPTFDYQRLVTALSGVGIVILTTIGADGIPHSRPMALQQVLPDGSLWFFISRSSTLAQEITAQPKVAVAAAEHQRQAYVTVGGTARVVEDREKASTLWRDEYLAWFPLGINDPDLQLIRVEVAAAESWNEQSHLHFVLNKH